ncbi:MAG: translocation/assembly module TamB domain-containing protein [Pseudomonadota bacterium]|nr:translocation/assembly module TamB domain-containing protein [Pseudomonadota bacterium]
MKRRPLLLGLVVLLALLLTVLGLLLWASYSPALTQRLLHEVSDQVPELSLQYREGALARGLALDILYQDDDVTVDLQNTHIHLRPGCLWQLKVCVRSLTLDSLTIIVADSESDEQDDKPIELPVIAIPVPVTLDLLGISMLRVEDSSGTLYEARGIALAADAILHRVSISDLELEDEYCQWSGSGTIRLTRRYPLTVDILCDTGLYPFSQLSAAAQGDLDRLSITATTEGEVSAAVDVQLSPLVADLPLSFAARLNAPFVYPLEQGPITLEQGTLSGRGDLNRLTVETEGSLSSSLFPSPMNTALSGTLDFEELQLQEWRIDLPQGRIRTQGAVSFTPHLSWQANSQLSGVAFEQFYPEIQGNVTGSAVHSGAYIDDDIRLQLGLEQLSGTLFDTPWQLAGNLSLSENRISLQQIQVVQDQNRALAHGSLDLMGDSDLRLDLVLPNTQQFFPDLKGAVNAQLHLQGTLEKPSIDGAVQARALSYQDLQLQQANAQVDWQLAAEHDNRIDVQFTQLRVAEQVVVSGDLRLKGNAQSHRLALNLEEQEGNRFNLNCDAGFRLTRDQIHLDQWQANCRRSALQVAYLEPPQRWSLLQPLVLELKPGPVLQVAPFCYGYETGTLCLQQPVTVSGDAVSPVQLKGEQLYLSWLNPWLPSGMKLDGNIAFTGQLQVAEELEVTASLGSDNATLTLFEQDPKPVVIPFQRASINLGLAEHQVQLDWSLASSAGSSEGNIRLTLEQQLLSGTLSLSQITLAPFSPWLLGDDGDHIAGVINGRFQLGGSTRSPLLSGSARLSEGKIDTAMLPMPIKNIDIQLSTQDRIAELKGTFTVNKNPGHLQGLFNWQQEEWWSKVSFQSDTLAYQPDDNILIYIKPDIDFNLTPRTLNITGDVFVPKARIHLKSLPETAVSVSSDTIIVDDDAEQHDNLSISTKLKLTLGDDVRFKGYGLETDLTGQMTIRQQQSDLLRAKGIIRLEHGTYQAYGQSLTITDGDLIFIDDLENPQLRISATRDNISDNVVVGVRATGRAQNPDISIFSIPDMPEQEKFHYLVTGRAPNTDPTGDSSSVAAEAALSMALESRSGFTRKAGEKLGIQDLTLSTGSTENRSEVGLSGYITPDLMIRYGVGMFEAVNTLTLKYRIRRNLYAEVISGKSNAFDILWSFDRD